MARQKRYPSHVQAALDAVPIDESRLAPRAAKVQLILRFPPSTNNLYRSFVAPNGRVMRAKTKAAKDYAEHVEAEAIGWQFRHHLRLPAPPYRLDIQAYPPDDRQRHDLSNMFKCIEDALFAALNREEGVKRDDDQVVHVSGDKHEPQDRHGFVVVTLEGVGDALH